MLRGVCRECGKWGYIENSLCRGADFAACRQKTDRRERSQRFCQCCGTHFFASPELDNVQKCLQCIQREYYLKRISLLPALPIRPH